MAADGFIVEESRDCAREHVRRTVAALAIRGVLFATVSDPYLLVAVQVFDGITAAVFSVMIPLIVADVAFGSGHFNLAQGIVDPGLPARALFFEMVHDFRAETD